MERGGRKTVRTVRIKTPGEQCLSDPKVLVTGTASVSKPSSEVTHRRQGPASAAMAMAIHSRHPGLPPTSTCLSKKQTLPNFHSFFLPLLSLTPPINLSHTELRWLGVVCPDWNCDSITAGPTHTTSQKLWQHAQGLHWSKPDGVCPVLRGEWDTNAEAVSN